MALNAIALACLALLLALMLPGAGVAQVGSLFSGGSVQPLFVRVAPLLPPPGGADMHSAALDVSAPDSAAPDSAAPDSADSRFAGSLFDGPARGLFAPLPERFTGPLTQSWRGPVSRLRDLIASAEAGPDGYDAVQHGARIRPPKPPTRMTLGEIQDWIAATPGQPHAIGRYQIIPSTLRHLIAKEGLTRDARFDAALQDSLADVLMTEAGLQVFLSGDMARPAFMDRLARVWAGLPTANGKSHYHGYAGNSATMTRTRFDTEMAAIFPQS
jgi:hypothetical protein